MITAAEARALAGVDIDTLVSEASEQIKEAAKGGHRLLILRDGFWGNEAYQPTRQWRRVAGKLEGLGFKVTTFFRDGQFADVGTKIEW